jgi:Homocysteine S-methyltransferase
MTATQSNKAPVKAGLFDRLKSGPVICAEGYLFELERRGYLQAGAFVPEAVVENPEVVKRLHEDFVHAGSDVVEAFTYYAHRQKLRVIGRESILEDINRPVSCHVAALPVPYRTTEAEPTFQSLPTEAATAFRAAARFRPRSIRSPATATNARNSRANVSPSTCGTSGSAVALRPITSARSPRPSAALCRVVAIRRTCPSTPSSGPMQPFRIATRTAAPKSSM